MSTASRLRPLLETLGLLAGLSALAGAGAYGLGYLAVRQRDAVLGLAPTAGYREYVRNGTLFLPESIGSLGGFGAYWMIGSWWKLALAVVALLAVIWGGIWLFRTQANAHYYRLTLRGRETLRRGLVLGGAVLLLFLGWSYLNVHLAPLHLVNTSLLYPRHWYARYITHPEQSSISRSTADIYALLHGRDPEKVRSQEFFAPDSFASSAAANSTAGQQQEPAKTATSYETRLRQQGLFPEQPTPEELTAASHQLNRWYGGNLLVFVGWLVGALLLWEASKKYAPGLAAVPWVRSTIVPLFAVTALAYLVTLPMVYGVTMMSGVERPCVRLEFTSGDMTEEQKTTGAWALSELSSETDRAVLLREGAGTFAVEFYPMTTVTRVIGAYNCSNHVLAAKTYDPPGDDEVESEQTSSGPKTDKAPPVNVK